MFMFQGEKTGLQPSLVTFETTMGFTSLDSLQSTQDQRHTHSHCDLVKCPSDALVAQFWLDI